ncbi:MAG: AAA family ATPase [Bifidobacteriaceae bacterium]|jgi:hypothetical protein|nr:AAA family ATPase [Bifidobacteriaceae bacterium]
MGEAATRVLAALHGVAQGSGGNQWRALCPAHDDHSPSLSVTAIEGAVLVHCHAGCAIDDVVEAIGMTKADLYDNHVGADYNYWDGGSLLRTVHRREAWQRSESKRFTQTVHDKSHIPLYHVDAVRTQVERGEIVMVVEGEKDVHAAEAMGWVATTSPMGASNWRKVDSSPLTGARVVVCGDQDKAGARFVKDVVASLAPITKELWVAAPAEDCHDLADHIAAGKDWADLRLSQAPPVVSQAATGRPDKSGPSVVTLSEVERQYVEWLWPRYLPAGKLVVFDGDPSVGKSTLTLDLAARCSTGEPWPDGAPNGVARDVLLLSAEDGLADTIVARLDAARADRSRIHALRAVIGTGSHNDGQPEPPSLPQDIPTLERVITERKVKLVIVDVLMAYLGGRVDSHRDQDVRRVLHRLAEVAERTGAVFILIRHLNKDGGGTAMYRGGGSIGIIGAARAAYLVARHPDDNERRVLVQVKSNLGPEPPALAYRLTESPEHGCARIEWEAEPLPGLRANDLLRTATTADGPNHTQTQQFILDHLIAHGGSAKAREVFEAGKEDGFTEHALKRARSTCKEPKITTQKVGYGDKSYQVWSIASQHGDTHKAADAP